MADSEITPDPSLAAAPNAIQPTRRFGYYQPSTQAEVDKMANWTMIGAMSLPAGICLFFMSLREGISLTSGGFVTSFLFIGLGIAILKTGIGSMKAQRIGNKTDLQPLDLRKLATGLSPQLADMERQIQVLLEEGKFQKAHALAEEVQRLAKIEIGAQPESLKAPARIGQSDT